MQCCAVVAANLKTMSDKIICWRGTDGDTEPIECICESEFGYPNYCTPKNGDREEKMYENTHFLKKEEAWLSIVRSVKAAVSLTGSAVKRELTKLAQLEKEAAQAVSDYYSVVSNGENPHSGLM